ncbi:hypothetical protein GCM10017673_58450 [Streptosporangium violaceochromogenes]|nr:hypothetical protein GCM10017673_58450 [Streptosporangium violaceochromogenes]
MEPNSLARVPGAAVGLTSGGRPVPLGASTAEPEVPFSRFSVTSTEVVYEFSLVTGVAS